MLETKINHYSQSRELRTRDEFFLFKIEEYGNNRAENVYVCVCVMCVMSALDHKSKE